jgi:hypothetical protein
METKICSKCGIEKPISNFQETPYSKYGVIRICKECKRKYGIEYRKQRLFLSESNLFFEGKKVKMLKSNKNPSHHCGGSSVSRNRIKKLGIDVLNKHIHHWNYNDDFDVILMDKQSHVFLHRFLKFNLETKTYFVNGTHTLLDTKERHIQFIDCVFNYFQIKKEIQSFKFEKLYKIYSNHYVPEYYKKS